MKTKQREEGGGLMRHGDAQRGTGEVWKKNEDSDENSVTDSANKATIQRRKRAGQIRGVTVNVRGDHVTGGGKEEDVKQTERNGKGRRVGGGDGNVSFCFF